MTQQKPVAWRCRWDDEQDWKYDEKPVTKRDFVKKMPGFEEQALYAESSPAPVEAWQPINTSSDQKGN
jgi:hypothetical protein